MQWNFEGIGNFELKDGKLFCTLKLDKQHFQLGIEDILKSTPENIKEIIFNAINTGKEQKVLSNETEIQEFFWKINAKIYAASDNIYREDISELIEEAELVISQKFEDQGISFLKQAMEVTKEIKNPKLKTNLSNLVKSTIDKAFDQKINAMISNARQFNEQKKEDEAIRILNQALKITHEIENINLFENLSNIINTMLDFTLIQKYMGLISQTKLLSEQKKEDEAIQILNQALEKINAIENPNLKDNLTNLIKSNLNFIYTQNKV